MGVSNKTVITCDLCGKYYSWFNYSISRTRAVSLVKQIGWLVVGSINEGLTKCIYVECRKGEKR